MTPLFGQALAMPKLEPVADAPVGNFFSMNRSAAATHSLSPISSIAATTSSSSPSPLSAVGKSASGGKNSKKSSSQMSEVWNHYTMSEEGLSVTCKHCGRNMKRTDSSTKSMWGHLKSFHAAQVGQETFDRKRKRCVKPKQPATGMLLSHNAALNSDSGASAAKRKKISTTKKVRQSANDNVLAEKTDIDAFRDFNLANLIALAPCFSSLPMSTSSTTGIFDLLSGVGDTSNGSASSAFGSVTMSPIQYADEAIEPNPTTKSAENLAATRQQPADGASDIFSADTTTILENIISIAASGLNFEQLLDGLAAGNEKDTNNGGSADDVNALAFKELCAALGGGSSGVSALTRAPSEILETVYALFGSYFQGLANPAEFMTKCADNANISTAADTRIDVENVEEKVGDYLKKQLQSGQKLNDTSFMSTAAWTPELNSISPARNTIINSSALSHYSTSEQTHDLTRRTGKVNVGATASDDERLDGKSTISHTSTNSPLSQSAAVSATLRLSPSHDVSRPSSTSASSLSPTMPTPVSLQSPESLIAMHQIAFDLNLVYTMRRRDDGTPEFVFRQNDGVTTTKENSRHVTLTETADKMFITEQTVKTSLEDDFTPVPSDAVNNGIAGQAKTDTSNSNDNNEPAVASKLSATTEMWVKSSVTQIMWAVRGKCQKCFSVAN